MPTLAPISKEFVIKDGPGLSADDPIVVAFRQATEGSNIEREELLTRKLSRDWEENKDELSMPNQLRRRAVEVFLTVKALNVVDEKGKELIKFKKGRPDYPTFNAFEKVWGEMPPDWAISVHLCCLATNPSWAGDWYGLSGDITIDQLRQISPILDKIMTEGNEDGGEESQE